MQEENNKLIAEFMNCEKVGDKYAIPDHLYGQITSGWGYDYEPKYMCYDIAWDWLMPVVRKINRMRQIRKFYHKAFIVSDEGELFVSSDITETYEAVVAFIKYANKFE